MSLKVKCHLPLQHFALDVAVSIPTQGITAIVGPSGSGKTTFLEVFSGVRQVANAEVSFNQTLWQQREFLPLNQRRVGLVLQHPSLFPHLNVADNLRYGWQRARGRKELGWDEVIAACDLNALLQQFPAQLSGGSNNAWHLPGHCWHNPSCWFLMNLFRRLMMTRASISSVIYAS
ncbi:ATP-binding cassette domain-containing protein [Pseudidiomarina halophila]|uniref:ATP-binding cassette domain-containing protein n=1 Tax=Pseudidiomarina halophila TaxID=1449799 RepID=UPI00360C80FC